MEIVKIDIHRLIAGTKYRGDFEERSKKIIDELRNNPYIIAYIEELHTIKGLGLSESSTFDLLNTLKPYLSEGQIKIIGDTTTEEYDKFIARDPAFSRRFIVDTIKEPEIEALKKIIIGKIKEFSNYYNIKFDFNGYNMNIIMDTLIALSDSKKRAYYSTRKNPDFVIDIIENIFALAAYNNHKDVTFDDVIKGLLMTKDISNDYKNRMVYNMQNLLANKKKEDKSRVLTFPKQYSLE